MDDPFYPNLIIHTNVKKIVIYICICWPSNFLKDHKKSSRTWRDFYVFIKIIQLRLLYNKGYIADKDYKLKDDLASLNGWP